MTEWLANLKIEYVIIISIVLLVVRLVLKRYDTPLARSTGETVESALIAVVLVYLVIRPFVIQAFFIPSESMVPTLEVHDYILVNKFVYRFREPQRGDIVVFKAPPAAAYDELLQMQELGRMGGLDPAQCRKACNLMVGVVGGPRSANGEVDVRLTGYHQRNFDKLKLVCLVKPGEWARVLDIEKITHRNGRTSVKFAQINDRSFAEDLAGAEIRIIERDYIKRLIGLPGDVIEVKNDALYRNGKRVKEEYAFYDLSKPAYEMPPFTVPKGSLFMMGDNRYNSKDSHEWGPLDRNRVIGKAMFRFWPIPRMGLVR